MDIRAATLFEAPVIHHLMIKAFGEYKDVIPPSSALEETVQSVSNALENGENALIAYEENNPVGMVRFQLNKEGLYFYRLSVIPEQQGKGIAKKLLYSLEDYAIESRVSALLCKVRMTVSKNIKLYSSLGYRVYDEEEVYKPNGIVLRIVSMQKEV